MDVIMLLIQRMSRESETKGQLEGAGESTRSIIEKYELQFCLES